MVNKVERARKRWQLAHVRELAHDAGFDATKMSFAQIKKFVVDNRLTGYRIRVLKSYMKEFNL